MAIISSKTNGLQDFDMDIEESGSSIKALFNKLKRKKSQDKVTKQE